MSSKLKKLKKNVYNLTDDEGRKYRITDKNHYGVWCEYEDKSQAIIIIEDNLLLAKFFYNAKGQKHHLLGPAVQTYEGIKQYYINGVEYSEKEFYQRLN